MISKKAYLLYMIKALIIYNANKLGWEVISMKNNEILLRKSLDNMTADEYSKIDEQILRTNM